MRKRRITAVVLILATFLLSVLATAGSAASVDSTEVTGRGGEAVASVPVTLTVSNEYRSISVTVPASLPVSVRNGTVSVADNAKITNNSKNTPVRVTSVDVRSGAYGIGNYDCFSGKNMIALKINGCPTKGEGKLSITDTSFPEIPPMGNLALRYYVKLSGGSENVKDLEVASVIFTISASDVASSGGR